MIYIRIEMRLREKSICLTLNDRKAPITHPDFYVEPVLQDELKLILPVNHPLNALSFIHFLQQKKLEKWL